MTDAVQVRNFMGRKSKPGVRWPEIVSTSDYRRLRVGFDLDGVLYDFGESVRRYLEHTGQGHLYKSGPTKKAFWNFYEDWGWDAKQFVEFCNAGADAGFIFCGPARPNAVATMNAVKRLGHEVVIITDRGFGKTPEVSHNHTRNWLSEHGFQYDELHFSADKTSQSTDIFVEDKLQNYDALTKAGTETYLINRGWNELEDERNRINDISEYLFKVIDKSFIVS